MSGKIEYVVSVNDTGVSGKVNSLKTGLTGVGTAATQAATKTQSLGTGLGTVATKGGQASGVMTKLKGSFAGTATGMAGLGLGIAGVASQIVGMADAYDNLKDTEFKLAAQRGKVKTMTTNVKIAENNLLKMRKDGKAGTVEYKLAEQALADKKGTLKAKTDLLTNAEDDYQRAQRAFYLQIGPQIIGIMAQMGSSVLIMKSASAGAGVGMEGMSKGAKLLSVALKAIPLVAIAGAILAIRNNTFGFRDALESVGVKIGEILPGLKPFLDWVHDMAAALGLTGGGVDFGKAFELLKTGFTSAIDTIMNTDWTTVLGQMMDKISNWFNTADWKVLWQKFQEAIFAGGDWVAKQLDDVGKKIVDWFNAIKWADVWNAFRSALGSATEWVSKNLGLVLNAITDWFKAQKWDLIWANFQNAVISSVDWINTNFKKIFNAIETWIKAQDWAVIWKAFQDAFVSSVTWVGEKLGAIYTAAVIWAKKQNWAAIGKIIQDALFAGVTVIAGSFDTWGANVIKEVGAGLIKSVKTLGGILTSDSKFIGGLQQAFTDAGKDVDWVSVGNALLYDFFLDVGKWEFKTFHKTIAASFQTTFEAMAAIIDFKNTATKFVQGIGNAIGTALSGGVQAITDAGKAFVLELGKAIVTAVTGVGTWATDLLKGVGNTIKTKASTGVTELQNAGAAIWDQIAKGIQIAALKLQTSKTIDWGAIWKAIQGAFGMQIAEGGIPLGGTINIDPKVAIAQIDMIVNRLTALPGIVAGLKLVFPAPDTTKVTTMIDALLAVWQTKSTTMAAIIPALSVNTKSATDLVNALVAVWQSKSTTMAAIIPVLSVDIKTIAGLIDTVVKYWQTKSTTIEATKPALSANNTDAINIIDAVTKRWQSAVSTINGMVAQLKANNSDALSKINAVVSAQNKIKNITQTITTVYKTVGSPAHAHNIVAAHAAHNIGGGEETVAIAPLIGGGGMATTAGGGGAGMGDVNITIVNRDEFGTEKIRKFKAVLGKDRYLFGSVGAGG